MNTTSNKDVRQQNNGEVELVPLTQKDILMICEALWPKVQVERSNFFDFSGSRSYVPEEHPWGSLYKKIIDKQVSHAQDQG